MDDVTPIRRPEMLLEVGGPVDETRVTLALYSDELDPEAVSRRLGCAPTHAHRKGDRRGPKSPPSQHGAWLLTVEGKAPLGPDELANLLLGPLPGTDQFWFELCRDFRVHIRVGIHTDGWNRGFALRPDTTKLLAATGATVGFDLYLYGDGDE